MNTLRTLLGSACLAAATAHVQAHVSVDPPRAPASSTVKAALRVGHGCEGRPTHTVHVRLPEGFRGAKPMPKAGWALTIRKAALATPYDSHGRTITEDTVEVTWTARTRDDWLEDTSYDEFVVRGQLPAQAGPLWFKVRQQCDVGSWDWSELPASGASTRGLKAPAVLFEVTPSAAAEHQH